MPPKSLSENLTPSALKLPRRGGRSACDAGFRIGSKRNVALLLQLYQNFDQGVLRGIVTYARECRGARP
jgi:hypothetical protein